MLLRSRVVVLTQDFHEALEVVRVLAMVELAFEVIVELVLLEA